VQAFRQLGSPYHLAVALLDQADYLAETMVWQAGGRLLRRLQTSPDGWEPCLCLNALDASPEPMSNHVDPLRPIGQRV
jgi:hypothetical protein